MSTADFFPDSMSFNEKIIKNIIHKENQEEGISFEIISKEVETVLSELVGKIKDQISKLNNKNLTRRRQRNKANLAIEKRIKSCHQ